MKETHRTADYWEVHYVHQPGQSQTHKKTHSDTERLCTESGKSSIYTVTFHSQILEIAKKKNQPTKIMK